MAHDSKSSSEEDDFHIQDYQEHQEKHPRKYFMQDNSEFRIKIDLPSFISQMDVEKF